MLPGQELQTGIRKALAADLRPLHDRTPQVGLPVNQDVVQLEG
jgi:hypothetical protein